jgi:hypothetical protein
MMAITYTSVGSFFVPVLKELQGIRPSVEAQPSAAARPVPSELQDALRPLMVVVANRSRTCRVQRSSWNWIDYKNEYRLE